MKIEATRDAITTIVADAAVIGVYQNQPLAGIAATADRATGGVLTRLIELKEISGKKHEVVAILAPAGLKVGQLLVVGLGEKSACDAGVAFRAAGAASKHLAGKTRQRVVFYLADDLPAELVESALAGAMVGCQGQDLYRAEKKRLPFQLLLWAGGHDDALHSGQIVGASVNLARRLVNEPPQDMTPESFAEHAHVVSGDCGLVIEIWDQQRLEAERCGSLLAVAKGSSRPPRMVILRHLHGPKNQKPLALVGKGVTFDSGGLSLKPSDSMKTMKCDMAGAASVLASMQAIAQLQLPINVIGMMGLVENMPGPCAMKLGDVLHARNGRTIEVQNTDAEGRLVLADVLSVAVDLGVERIIDLATLTGACVVALGLDVAGLMTNDQAWCDTISQAAGKCGEPVWQLPMFPEYSEQIRSEVADIRNTGEGRWGGAIAAAKFLEEFVAGVSWTHIDIAGPAFAEKSLPHLDGGGTGAYVRTLIEIARGYRPK